MLLIAGASAGLGTWLAQALEERHHDVRQTDMCAAHASVLRCSLHHEDASLREVVRGVEQIVVITNFLGGSTALNDGDQWLDIATRGAYNLLCAACEAAVKRVVIVSCLDVFEKYAADLVLDPQWMPRPSCSPQQLGPHLTEFVAREYAYVGINNMRVTVVRMGQLSGSYGAAEKAAVQALVSVVGETLETEQARRSNASFFLPPGEQTRYSIIHLPSVGYCPRAVATPDKPTNVEHGHKPSKVLVIGGGGILGPAVVEELGQHYELRVTDVSPDKRNPDPSRPLTIPDNHEYIEVDIADRAAVDSAIAGTDAVVNLSVMRLDRKLAFDVNCNGVYNAIRAAVSAGHARFINTGPHFTITGSLYVDYDFGIDENVPAHPGVNLYSLSKALGQEICRVTADNEPIYVMTQLYGV